MHLKATRPREAVADVIARLVDGTAWSGSIGELHVALGTLALPEERRDPAWPRSAIVLASGLVGLSDALRERGLRMSRMPAELLIERLSPMTNGPRPAQGAASRAAS